MNLNNFLIFCENYYGEKYDGIRREIMLNYLDGKTDDFFDSAARVLVTRFSRINRISPGPAEIERYLDEIKSNLPPKYILDFRKEMNYEQKKQYSEMMRAWREDKVFSNRERG
jgi:SNF2 family DNA or RNA helicase